MSVTVVSKFLDRKVLFQSISPFDNKKELLVTFNVSKLGKEKRMDKIPEVENKNIKIMYFHIQTRHFFGKRETRIP